MADYIFTMIRASKFYGADRKVLENITLAFLPGAKIGVLGANGAGKSTLLRMMAGREEPSSGRAELAAGATVGLVEQEPELDLTKDVRGNVEHGIRRLRHLLTRFDEISAGFSEPEADFDALIAEQAIVQEQIDRADAWSLDATIDRAIDALRLPDGDRDVSTLSGGERRRVALARVLLSTPDLLLLDEPTNHLDAESVAWLERFLANYAGTVVAVTHDRYFLDNVAGWILELDRGKGIPYEGNYSGWLEQKQARLAGEEKHESARRRALARELEWVRASPKARHAKSKARVAAYQKLLDAEQNVKLDRVEIHIPAGPRLGDLVVAADGLAKSFGDTLLFEDLSFSLPPGGIVGVVGPNGAGKTTLFRMIVGDEAPNAGEDTGGRHSRDRLRRSGARRPDAIELGLDRNFGWARLDRARIARGELPTVRLVVQLQGHRSAETRRRPLRRRAKPRPPRQAPAQRRQPATTRRADERP